MVLAAWDIVIMMDMCICLMSLISQQEPLLKQDLRSQYRAESLPPTLFWLVFVLFLPFDWIRARVIHTKMLPLRQYDSGERVHLVEKMSTWLTARHLLEYEVDVLAMWLTEHSRHCCEKIGGCL